MHTSRFILLALSFLAFVPAAHAVEVNAKQAYIIDYDTGQVLYEKNAHDRMPTSSMSKVATMYMVFDALKKGQLSLDQNLPVSQKAWSTQGSKMFVPIGENVKVEDLIRGVIIQSGNDATIVLAEGVAGSEGEFALRMTEKMKNDLGMTESNFVNASGWPDDNHYSTARDLTLLGRAMVRDFPDYYKYYSEKEFTYNNIKQGNRNPLLYRNMGVDGIKTGHTEAAGYGLMASGVRDGRRVVMTLNGMDSMQARADESAKMMEWALMSFKNLKLLQKDATLAEAPVVMGQATSVPIVAPQDLVVTVPRMGASDAVAIKAVYNAPLIAPVKKGDQIGKLVVSVARMEPIELPLLAGGDVAGQSFFKKLQTKIEIMIFGNQSGVKAPGAIGTVVE